MTNKKRNQSQETLFDWVKRADEIARQTNNPHSGSLDIDSEFRAAVTADLKAAKDTTGRELSRYEVAARMSELVGHEITATSLYNFTSDSHERHRFPCQYLPAFVIATGQRQVFEVLSRRAGLFALPGPEVLRAEIQRIDEQVKELQAQKQKRRLFLMEVENGKGK